MIDPAVTRSEIRDALERSRAVAALFRRMSAESRALLVRSRAILQAHAAKAGKKGAEAWFNDNGQNCAAVIVEVLSSTRALIRAMEGLLAGQEIEAEFPTGCLEYEPHRFKPAPPPRPRLYVVGGSGDPLLNELKT
jgi:hypothetical protein